MVSFHEHLEVLLLRLIVRAQENVSPATPWWSRTWLGSLGRGGADRGRRLFQVGRRKQMARQTIARMLNGQAAGVFDSFVAAVVASKERRATARKVCCICASFAYHCRLVNPN